MSFLIVLAEHAGHRLELGRLKPEAMLRATIVSFSGNEKPLVAEIGRLIR